MQAILLEGYQCRIDWLQEVVVDNLLPGRLILAFEHILKLLKRVRPVKMDFLGPFVKIRDGFVDSELDSEFATVNVDFRF